MAQSKSFPCRSIFGLTLLLCLFASPSFAQIATALHAYWDSDLTDSNPGSCVTSGTVANPLLHFVVAYKSPIVNVSVDWTKIEEQPTQHVPSQTQYNSPSGNRGFPSECRQLPVSDPEQWMGKYWLIPDPYCSVKLNSPFWLLGAP
jgi:hypothetical protein